MFVRRSGDLNNNKMSKVFEKLIKEAVKENCDIAQLDNESEVFVIYLISNGSGFPVDLLSKEILEVKNFLRKVKKTKGNFAYLVDNKEYFFNVRFYQDFGEEVFKLIIKK